MSVFFSSLFFSFLFLGVFTLSAHMITLQEFFSTAHVSVYQLSTFLLLGDAT
jgi:hypothetical protein